MDIVGFHKATTNELLALSNKVRFLISHSAEEGRYKEAVLKNVIRRFIPERFSLGTGFVVKPGANRGQHSESKQIDLIIYDSMSPLLFKEGDFVIITPDAVRGIIEVKANLYNQNITEVIKTANENGKFIFQGRNPEEDAIFNGIFSFDRSDSKINYSSLQKNITNGHLPLQDVILGHAFLVNHISFDKDCFYRYWPVGDYSHSIYDIKDLSFPFFISNLVSFLAGDSIAENGELWFAIDKELNNIQRF
jgi:hypothetical protein